MSNQYNTKEIQFTREEFAAAAAKLLTLQTTRGGCRSLIVYYNDDKAVDDTTVVNVHATNLFFAALCVAVRGVVELELYITLHDMSRLVPVFQAASETLEELALCVEDPRVRPQDDAPYRSSAMAAFVLMEGTMPRLRALVAGCRPLVDGPACRAAYRSLPALQVMEMNNASTPDVIRDFVRYALNPTSILMGSDDNTEREALIIADILDAATERKTLEQLSYVHNTNECYIDNVLKRLALCISESPNLQFVGLYDHHPLTHGIRDALAFRLSLNPDFEVDMGEDSEDESSD